MKEKRPTSLKVIILITLMIALSIFFYWQNNALMITELEFSSSDIVDSFEGFKIVQISDLHNKDFGEDPNKLIQKIQAITPDIIVITGDLIDSRHTDINTAIKFAEAAQEIAPVYFVSGNHESNSGKYEELCEKLVSVEAVILDNKSVMIAHSDGAICLSGLIDPAFLYDRDGYTDAQALSVIQTMLQKMIKNDIDVFDILLSHRPELIDLYADAGADLVFTGHAHGGQFRLPFINGGLIAPNQGIFPKYTSGMYKNDKTAMIVSRGVGNSIVPIRIFNRPEIIVVTLHSE